MDCPRLSVARMETESRPRFLLRSRGHTLRHHTLYRIQGVSLYCRHYRVLSVTEPEWSCKNKKIISFLQRNKKIGNPAEEELSRLQNWNTLYTTYTGSVVLLIAQYKVFHYT